MKFPDPKDLAPWLEYLSGISTPVIACTAIIHLVVFLILWIWYGRDLRVIAGCLDDFTRGLKHRSVLGRSAPLTNQIDAFVEDINDVLSDDSRHADRVQCLHLSLIHI